jgi:5-methylcytosine-specific restriction endonuclease McrA
MYLKATMSRLRQREPRLKLDLEQYRLLRQSVLQRDGWRCQLCGSLRDLQVHHRKFRSRLGDDSAQNLITLCVDCHQAKHDRREHC